MSDEKERTFEETMEELEEVVTQLEQGDVPLEEAISMFQKGMKLSKICHEKLTVVEKQIEELLNDDIELDVVTVQEDHSK